MTTRRNILGGLAAGSAAIAAPRVVRAAGTTLTFSSWLPPNHPIVVGGFEPWIEDIAEATEGRVRVRMFAKPLGGAPAHFDMARDGIADITYGLHSFTPSDKFALTRVAEFSFLGDDAAELSAAYWNTYTSMFGGVDEHAGTHLLSLYCHGPGCLHTAPRPIDALDDLRGLKIRTPGGYISQLVESLGGVPMLVPSPEVYEVLANGVADGVAFTLEALTAFKLVDLLKYTKTFPGGLYNTSWFVVMNPSKWQALEARDRDAITALSGEAFARRVGKVWTEADANAQGAIEAGGVAITPADDALVRAIMPVADRIEEAWVVEAQKRGVDGRAAIDAIREANNVALPT